MRRVVVVGTSGSGKSTLARAIAERLVVDHVELDALQHGPGWTMRDPAEFQRLILDAVDSRPDGWVICGNYGGRSGRVHWPLADTIIWLDLPRGLVMRQLLLRTLGRLLMRTELWNGNRESVGNLWRRDGVLRYAWRMHPGYTTGYEAAMADPAWMQLRFVRLRSHAEARAWLDELDEASGA